MEKGGYMTQSRTVLPFKIQKTISRQRVLDKFFAHEGIIPEKGGFEEINFTHSGRILHCQKCKNLANQAEVMFVADTLSTLGWGVIFGTSLLMLLLVKFFVQ